MSHVIPPFLTSTPPPIDGPIEEDEDEFGDFTAATNSFDCDDFSLPPSPEVDINSNKSQLFEAKEQFSEPNEITCDETVQSQEESNDESLPNSNRSPSPKSHFEEDFGNFTNFDEDFETAQSVDEEEDDDFGDFESSETPTVEIDVKNAADKTEAILKDIFPAVDSDDCDFNLVDSTDNVFEELKDVTETKALVYQWSKSHSQKMFFKALNIDTRNILYGPAWNGSMPRFAANLSMAPLEPVKSEILVPTPVQNMPSPSISSQKPVDIPTAQFDWSNSGLVNPLDYSQTMLLDLEQLVASLDIPSTTNPIPNQSSLGSNDLLEEWDLWLHSTTTEPPGSEEIPQTPTEVEVFPNLFEKDKNIESFESPKLIPLRETHIFNELNDGTQPGWLQPTIVTPDLPRKETISVEQLDDEEFDDFQMVLPEAKKDEEQTHVIEETIEPIPKPDDEFTEFHSSEPKMLTPISLEPLKPVVQYTSPATINWPDPGVSEDDIRNIELNYSRKVEIRPKKDDDEWSDFVSVKTERTATPDLPLSVLNLSSVQPPKQPIPVITPNGLVQTKLSTNLKSIVHDDDDDWSDFVSSRPASQTNGYQVKTNIIMNPTHSFSLPQNKNVPIPTISSLPDLDFIAPRNRTSKK